MAGFQPVLYVTNLDPTTTCEEVKAYFQHYGDVKVARLLPKNKQVGPNGVAFIHFYSTEAALSAIQGLDGVVRDKDTTEPLSVKFEVKNQQLYDSFFTTNTLRLAYDEKTLNDPSVPSRPHAQNIDTMDFEEEEYVNNNSTSHSTNNTPVNNLLAANNPLASTEPVLTAALLASMLNNNNNTNPLMSNPLALAQLVAQMSTMGNNPLLAMQNQLQSVAQLQQLMQQQQQNQVVQVAPQQQQQQHNYNNKIPPGTSTVNLVQPFHPTNGKPVVTDANAAKVYVSNIQPETTDQTISAFFSRYGMVSHIQQITAYNAAIVTFASASSAQQVLQQDALPATFSLPGQMLQIRPRTSKYAAPGTSGSIPGSRPPRSTAQPRR